MLNLPLIIIDLLDPFAPCFHGVTTWTKAQILLVGTLLAPGKRTVTAALRVMGLTTGSGLSPHTNERLGLAFGILTLILRGLLPCGYQLGFSSGRIPSWQGLFYRQFRT